MAATPEADRDAEERSRLVHRETLQLFALIAIAVAAFLVTRAIAMSNRDMTLRDAAEWFRRGQSAMQAGHLDDAIESLRRATVRDRQDRQYVLALARALALKKDLEGARTVLLALRDANPEDREINFQLARLAAQRQDVTEAVRFYHNTLYAPWPTEMGEARRAVRVELARFLLDHHQTGRALAELLALTADMPDDVALHVQVGQLFADAGDETHAIEHFRMALHTDPGNREAIAGAGLAAFRLGDYAGARSYLRRLPDTDDVRTTREVVELVLARDPLAPRLGSIARRQRLLDDIDYVDTRIHACIAGGNRSAEAAGLANDTQAYKTELGKPGALEQDAVEAGVELIARVEEEIAMRCGATTPLDQALALIGRRHHMDSR